MKRIYEYSIENSKFKQYIGNELESRYCRKTHRRNEFIFTLYVLLVVVVASADVFVVDDDD